MLKIDLQQHIIMFFLLVRTIYFKTIKHVGVIGVSFKNQVQKFLIFSGIDSYNILSNKSFPIMYELINYIFEVKTAEKKTLVTKSLIV